MRRLRSRWTVVALVPACFLASFGLVTALAGGGEKAVPAAADAGTESAGESAGPAVTEVGPTTTAESAPSADTATTGADGQTTGTTGDGNRNEAPAPPPGTISVDYGRWEGMFEISDTAIAPEFGIATVTGDFRYLGGGACSQVGVVELRGRFYSPSGEAIGNGLWESIWVTGNGAEVPQREPLYLEFYGSVSEEAASARIRFTRVDCL
jgi:hypothetical protein